MNFESIKHKYMVSHLYEICNIKNSSEASYNAPKAL